MFAIRNVRPGRARTPAFPLAWRLVDWFHGTPYGTKLERAVETVQRLAQDSFHPVWGPLLSNRGAPFHYSATVNALDSRGVEDVLSQHGRTIVALLEKQIRSKNWA